MAIRTQEYRPDTCNCIIIESWDDSVSQEQRIHSMQAVVRRCSFHAAILDASLYAVLQEENQRKNKAWVKAAELAGQKVELVQWSYDPGRTLTITFDASVSQNKKDAVQNWCDTNLGIGKVIVL